MIELKFYRDDEYVYINNPDGTTKRMTITEFEAMLNGTDEYVRVDPTLTQSGQAADAKKTGDEITGLKEDLYRKSAITWTNEHGIANGVFSEGDAACTPMLETLGFVNIGENSKAIIFLYSRTAYLGKMNSNYQLDQQSGSWGYYTGFVDVGKIIKDNSATGARIEIIPTDSTIITDETVQTYGDSHCDVYLYNFETVTDANERKNDLNVLNDLADTAYICTKKAVDATATGWRLNESDGFCTSNSSYKMVKYAVVEGDLIKVVSDDRFQFQTAASVPSTGTSNRVGKTYGTGEFYLKVPTGATYLIISTPVSGSVANCYATSVKIDELMTLPEIKHKLDNARHIKGNTATPLTILHFSDLHNDRNALSRIMADAENAGTLIDEKICTGDIVGNTYEEISSWWDSSVLTCIGNHDTASYNISTGYNWTALSMADRDAYYIAPFESNWGIVHTAGTSYYYKDYATQKIRLIVMDAMLYTGTAGAEATAQTAWLTNLLADAITNELHVLIAIHAPHGGATAEDCSFSRYAQGTMPTYSDCNTPQAVIDAVASAITNGLHFIGYIVGHMHQDNIWDAEGDGKQLMYCITCSAVTDVNQWKNSDQNRSVSEDAYNLVTIDTANTLVKIVRGGGADIDDHMRSRKAICFNYSTGEKVGEVL